MEYVGYFYPWRTSERHIIGKISARSSWDALKKAIKEYSGDEILETMLKKGYNSKDMDSQGRSSMVSYDGDTWEVYKV